MPYEHDAPPGYEPPPEPKRRMPSWWYPPRTGAGVAVGLTLAAVLWLLGVRSPFGYGLGVACVLVGELVVWAWRRHT